MGYHSLLAFWVGGAGRVPPPPGYRSAFGFWLGGAGMFPSEEPPVVIPTAGGGFRAQIPRRARKLNDEEELIAVITAAIHAGLLQ